MRFDEGQGCMVAKFDTLASAKDYGDLRVLVDSSLATSTRQDCIDKIVIGLADYNDDDFFLPMGSHYFMMIAAVVISRKVQMINTLEWNGREKQYRRSLTKLDRLR